MICKNCGNEIESNLRFCTHCGAMQDPSQVQEEAVNAPVQEQPGAQQGGQYQAGMSYNEFYNAAVSKKSQGWPKWLMIICFVSAALYLIVAFLNPLSFLDVAVYAVCGFMLAKSKTKTWALVATAYSCLGTILGLINGAGLTGVVALILGFMSIRILDKVDKAYKTYQQTGVIPEPQI